MAFSGKRLQQIRKLRGLSQSQLAKAAGLPVASLQKWEIGYRNPKLDALIALAAALDVQLAELVGEASKRH